MSSRLEVLSCKSRPIHSLICVQAMLITAWSHFIARSVASNLSFGSLHPSNLDLHIRLWVWLCFFQLRLRACVVSFIPSHGANCWKDKVKQPGLQHPVLAGRPDSDLTIGMETLIAHSSYLSFEVVRLTCIMRVMYTSADPTSKITKHVQPMYR